MSDPADILAPPLPPPQGVDHDAFTLAYLASHEAECPACGYNVHALQVPRCPECGRPLKLRIVGLATGFTGAWIACLVTTAISGGIGLFVLAVCLHEGLPRHQFGLMLILLFFMSNIPLPAILLFIRRWFVRMPAHLQGTIALVVGLASAAMFAGFLWEILD